MVRQVAPIMGSIRPPAIFIALGKVQILGRRSPALPLRLGPTFLESAVLLGSEIFLVDSATFLGNASMTFSSFFRLEYAEENVADRAAGSARFLGNTSMTFSSLCLRYAEETGAGRAVSATFLGSVPRRQREVSRQCGVSHECVVLHLQ
jgi:hypothetical protein